MKEIKTQRKMNKTAFFIVKEAHFKDIANGDKMSEFRNASPYWIDRLDNSITEAIFQLGYGSGGQTPPRMKFSVIALFVHDTIHKIVIPYPRSVADIPKGFRSCLIEVKLGRRLD